MEAECPAAETVSPPQHHQQSTSASTTNYQHSRFVEDVGEPLTTLYTMYTPPKPLLAHLQLPISNHSLVVVLKLSRLVQVLGLSHTAGELLQRLEGNLLLDGPLWTNVNTAAVLHLL